MEYQRIHCTVSELGDNVSPIRVKVHIHPLLSSMTNGPSSFSPGTSTQTSCHVTAGCVGCRGSFAPVLPGWGMRPSVPIPGACGESPCVDWERASWAVVRRRLEAHCIWMRWFTTIFQTLRTFGLVNEKDGILTAALSQDAPSVFLRISRPKGLQEISSCSSIGMYYISKSISKMAHVDN